VDVELPPVRGFPPQAFAGRLGLAPQLQAERLRLELGAVGGYSRQGFCALHELGQVCAGVALLLHRVGRRDELPLEGEVLHDADIVGEVRRRGDRLEDLGDIRRAAQARELPPCAQVLAEGDYVGRRPLVHQLHHGREYAPVPPVVEALGGEFLRRSEAPDVLRVDEHEAAEDGLFRVEVVRAFELLAWFLCHRWFPFHVIIV